MHATEAKAHDPAKEAMPAQFTMYGCRIRDFLGLETLLPHNELRDRGLVSEIPTGASVNFISHQWLGYKNADPEGSYTKTMQDLFRRAIKGENVLQSKDDWHAYGEGKETFRQSVANGWVWMEYAGPTRIP